MKTKKEYQDDEDDDGNMDGIREFQLRGCQFHWTHKE